MLGRVDPPSVRRSDIACGAENNEQAAGVGGNGSAPLEQTLREMGMLEQPPPPPPLEWKRVDRATWRDSRPGPRDAPPRVQAGLVHREGRGTSRPWLYEMT